MVWRDRLEAVAAEVATALTGLTGTSQGRERLGIGAGGDRTAVVDRRAEDAIVDACDRLAASGLRFRLRSEELGDRDYGAPTPILLADPVDGSLNAMFGIPYFCVALALLVGERLGDAVAGVVRNLAGAPTTYSAARGRGAWRDGQPLRPLEVALDDHGRIPMLVVEAHRSMGRGSAADSLAPLLRAASRVRLLGSSALSLCQVAGGAASALVAPDGMRPWDCAAGLLLLEEVGATVSDLSGAPLHDRPAGFGTATPIVASNDTAVHARVLELIGR